jgi:hypothetical protein
VIRGLGLDRHPELLPMYFGNYKRVVYLAQTHSPELYEKARTCAEQLSAGLPLSFEVRYTGLKPLNEGLEMIHQRPGPPAS